MPLRPNERVITISSSPATITLAIRMNELTPAIATGQTDKCETYVITGTHTMGGNITIAPNATGVATGVTFRFIYVADVTLGANTFQIFGYSMTAQQLLQNSTITCRYSGSAWDVVLNSSFTEDDIVATNHIIDLNVTTAKINTNAVTTAKILDANVTTSKLADGSVTTIKIADANVTTAKILDANVTAAKLATDSVTTVKILNEAVTFDKMADLNEGSLIQGDASDRPSELAIGTSTYVLQSNGTNASWVDPNSLPISNAVRYASLNITTAQMLALNGTPLTIVPAQGANQKIVVVRAAYEMTYNSAAYAANTTIQLLVTGAATAQFDNTTFLTATTNIYSFFADSAGGTISVIANQPLTVKVATGNPTTGNSDCTIHVWYMVFE